MIYTVTPNPALDITWGVPGWERGSTTRVTDIMESPGGKGLNVARVADQLGASACALGPLGGATGERVREALREPRTSGADPLGSLPGPHAQVRGPRR